MGLVGSIGLDLGVHGDVFRVWEFSSELLGFENGC